MRPLALVALASLLSPAAADSSLPEPPPGFGRDRPGASRTRLRDGRVLIAGGAVADPDLGVDVPVTTVEILDPRSGRRAAAAPLHSPRAWHEATLLGDGRVLVTGGVDPDVAYEKDAAQAELWDPATGRWRAVDGLPRIRDHTATLLGDGRVLVVGGHGVENECHRTSDEAALFDPATARMTPAGKLAERRGGHDAVLLADGRVLVVGGEQYEISRFCMRMRNRVAVAEVWDPRALAFAPAGAPREDRAGAWTLRALRGGGALLSGGRVQLRDRDGDPLCDYDQEGNERCKTRRAADEEWDPRTATWRFAR